MNRATEAAIWPEPEWNAERQVFLGQCPLCDDPPHVLVGDSPGDLLEAYRAHDEEWHPRLPDKDLHGAALLDAFLSPVSKEATWAKWAIRSYWWKYTGAAFDSLGHVDGADSDPNSITATDIVAVSMLDVHVPGVAARTMLDPSYGHDLHRLLVDVPHPLALHDAEKADVTPGAPASQLWHKVLESGTGMGPTITSKLVARKRPQLLPVYDTRLGYRLGIERGTNDWLWWWQWWHDDPSRVAATRELRSAAGAAHEGAGCLDASLLRILDVAVWRYDKHFRPKLRQPGAT